MNAYAAHLINDHVNNKQQIRDSSSVALQLYSWNGGAMSVSSGVFRMANNNDDAKKRYKRALNFSKYFRGIITELRDISCTVYNDAGAQLQAVSIPAFQLGENEIFPYELSCRKHDYPFIQYWASEQNFENQFLSFDSWRTRKGLAIIYNDEFTLHDTLYKEKCGGQMFYLNPNSEPVLKLVTKSGAMETFPLLGPNDTKGSCAAYLTSADYDAAKDRYAILVNRVKDNKRELTIAWTKLNR